MESKPGSLSSQLPELWRQGVEPEELNEICAGVPEQLLEVARFLMREGRTATARAFVLDAAAAGAAPLEVKVVQVQLLLDDGDLSGAQDALRDAQAQSANDARLVLLSVDLELRLQNPDGALSILERAIEKDPFDVGLQRKRVQVAVSRDDDRLVERSLEGLKSALRQHGQPTTEVHLGAAQAFARLGKWHKAISECRVAIAQAPHRVGPWLALATTARDAGRIGTALEAYRQAAQLAPSDETIRAAITALEAEGAELQRQAVTGGGADP